MQSVLLDTGFLYAVLDSDDSLHESCVKILNNTELIAILPDVVLPVKVTHFCN
jgi:predicted nucleic acid-binding protein